jgi:hypothetical protein
MNRVFAMHGIVKGADTTSFNHKNMDDWDSFVRHLEQRKTPYVSLDSFLANNGDALTIDDATYAAADAARVARSMGHEVTLFVNPWHVVEKKLYMPVLLNALLSGIVWERLVFQGQRYFVTTFEQKKKLRGYMRDVLCALDSPEKETAEIVACAQQNEIRLIIPDFRKTLTVDDVLRLKNDGVDIQNHGWFHDHHVWRTHEQKKANIRKGAAWLEESGIVPTPSRDYAAPFGTENEMTSAPSGEVWYLLDASRPEGYVGERMINRTLLTLE